MVEIVGYCLLKRGAVQNQASICKERIDNQWTSYGLNGIQIFAKSDGQQLALRETPGGYAGLLVGKIYSSDRFNVDNIVARPEEILDSLMSEYSKKGAPIFSHINGVFLALMIDTSNATLIIGSDRFNQYPLYYGYTDDRLWFGTSTRLIRQFSGFFNDIDDVSVMEMLRYGYILGDATLTAGISRLPVGSLLHCNKERVDFIRYFNGFIKDEDPVASKSDTIKALDATWQTAMDRISKLGSINISLTGGMDSRYILAGFKDLTNVSAFSLGTKGYDDMELGAGLAGTVGIAHEKIDISAEVIAELAEDVIRIGDGMLSILWAVFLYAYGKAGSNDTLILTGAAGGNIVGGRRLAHVLHAQTRDDLRQAVQKKTCLFPDEYLEAYLNADYCEHLLNATSKRFEEMSQTINHLHTDTDMFVLANYYRNLSTHGLTICALPFTVPIHAFYDVDFMDQIYIRTRPEYLVDELINSQMISYLSPALTKIRRAGKSTAVGTSPSLEPISYFIDRSVTFLGKRFPVLQRSKRFRISGRTTMDYLGALFGNKTILTFMQDNLTSSGFIKTIANKNLLDSMGQNPLDEDFAAILLTLVLYFKTFSMKQADIPAQIRSRAYIS